MGKIDYSLNVLLYTYAVCENGKGKKISKGNAQKIIVMKTSFMPYIDGKQ